MKRFTKNVMVAVLVVVGGIAPMITTPSALAYGSESSQELKRYKYEGYQYVKSSYSEDLTAMYSFGFVDAYSAGQAQQYALAKLQANGTMIYGNDLVRVSLTGLEEW